MTVKHFKHLNELDEARLWNWIDNPYGQSLVINGPAASGKTFLAQLVSSIIEKLYDRRPMIYDNCQLSQITLNELSGNINIIIQLNGQPTISNSIRYLDITVYNQNL
mgnify:CR=1 FL=1